MRIGDMQARAWQNKISKGFNTKDVSLEFGLLYGEVAEAFDAWRKGEPFGPELADVVPQHDDVVFFARGVPDMIAKQRLGLETQAFEQRDRAPLVDRHLHRQFFEAGAKREGKGLLG